MIKIAILIALIRLLLSTNRPFLCAGIYTVVNALFFYLTKSEPWSSMAILSLINFAFAGLYFWLLDRFEDNAFVFWPVAVLGALIGLV